MLNLPPAGFRQVLYLPTVALLAVLVLLPMAPGSGGDPNGASQAWCSHGAFHQWGVPQFMDGVSHGKCIMENVFIMYLWMNIEGYPLVMTVT